MSRDSRDGRDGRDSRSGSGRGGYSNTSVVQDSGAYRTSTGHTGAGYGGRQNYDRSPPSQRQSGGGTYAHAQGSRDSYTQPSGSYTATGHNYDQDSSYGIGSVYGSRPAYSSHTTNATAFADNQTSRYSATGATNYDTYNPNRGHPFSFLNTTNTTTASHLTPSSLQRQQQQQQQALGQGPRNPPSGAGTGFNTLQAMRQQLTQQQQQRGGRR